MVCTALVFLCCWLRCTPCIAALPGGLRYAAALNGLEGAAWACGQGESGLALELLLSTVERRILLLGCH